MSTTQQPADWRKICLAAGPFPLEAFHFVSEGLRYTAESIHGDPESLPELDRHVSGQQLCLGLRDYAIDRYGLLAPVVLATWQIRHTEDFGRIVFAMIDAGLMSRANEDTLEDFRGVYEFDEAFSEDELLSHLTA